MALERFVEAAIRKSQVEPLGDSEPDGIRGTDKVRTYVAGGWLYSKESDLEELIRHKWPIANEEHETEK